MSKYYLAYGSNLSIKQMSIRTPDARIIGTGILHDWQLLFRKYATIRKNKNFETPVLVWEISKKDERNLDRYEGFPRSYIKKNLTLPVTSLNGDNLGKLKAMVYIMTPEAVKNRSLDPVPDINYFSVIDEGYTVFNFDKRILKAALEDSFQVLML